MGTPTDAQRDAVVVVIDLGLERYVHAAADAGADVAIALSRAANELAGVESLDQLSSDSFVKTVAMEQSGALSATQAKAVLGELIANGGDPVSVAAAKGYEQLSSDSLEATIDELIALNPDEWGRYRDGDDKLAGFVTGLVMKATSGKANGKAVVAVLQSRR